MKEQLDYSQKPSDFFDRQQILLSDGRQKYWTKRTSRLRNLLGHDIKEYRFDLGIIRETDPEESVASHLVVSRPDVFAHKDRVLEIVSGPLHLTALLFPDNIHVLLGPNVTRLFLDHHLKTHSRILPIDWDVKTGPIPFPADSFQLITSPFLFYGNIDVGYEISRVLHPEGLFLLKGTAHLLTGPELASFLAHFSILELWHLDYLTSSDPFHEKSFSFYERHLVFALCHKKCNKLGLK